jgi:putative phosphoesterase
MKLAVISDIHSNMPAFKQVLKDMEKRRLETILCAGDIIGYGPSPNRTVETLKELKPLSVAGNHDYHISLKNLEWFNQDARTALIWTSKHLAESNKRFLLKLPKTLKTKINNKKIFLVHGSPLNHLYEYVYPIASDTILKRYLKSADADVLIMGHTHMPFARRISGRIVLNPGSVGQPRDMNPMASYCILDTETLKPKMVRIKYNIQETAQAMSEADLPEFLAQRLYLGI